MNAGGRKEFEKGRFDIPFRHMKGADLVPAGGVLAEILGGCLRPRPLDGVQPLQVERQGRVVGGNGVDQRTRQSGEGAAVAQPVEDPGAFPEAVEQSGVAQQLEMAGNARLALTQDLGQFAHRQLTMGAQGQQPQTCRFRRRLQCREQKIHPRSLMPSS